MSAVRVLLALLVVLAAAPAPAPAQSSTDDDKPRKEPPPKPAHAYPGPGWGFAHPRTGITFRGARADDLRELRVRGSISGLREGRVRNLRGRLGARFEVEGRFEPGETVTVRSRVPIIGAQEGAGRRWSFTIANSVGGPPIVSEPGVTEPEPWLDRMVLPCALQQRTLRTMPGFLPGGMCVVGRLTDGQGRLLLSLKPRGRGGPNRPWSAAVLSRTGKLLWYTQAPHELNDLKTVVIDDRRYLALFVRPPGQDGAYELYDDTYQLVGRIEAGNGYAVDSHDFQVAEDGTIWIGVYEPVWKSARRRITDYVVQQLDPVNGDVLFEWHALDHVPPQRSTYRAVPPVGTSWDFFHGNAIVPPTEADPTILVSARNTSAIYGIQPLTGRVEWILGGRRDTFNMDEHPKWQFCAQHDVRRTAPGQFTIFDNGGTRLNPQGCPVHPARAMHFRVDPEAGRAKVLDKRSSRDVTESPSTAYYPGSLGSARLSANGSWLIDWGTAGRVTQHRPKGRISFRMALGWRSYRAVLSPWKAMPTGKPLVAVERPGGADLDVFMSWNGATQIRRWRILAGPVPEQLTQLGRSVPFADLETGVRVQTDAPFLAVQALDAEREVLGQSDPIAVPPVPGR